ncbi:hypothetical protein Tco_0292918, partial [Tanacetum coccineum]
SMGKANLVWLCWQRKKDLRLVLCLWVVLGKMEEVGCLRCSSSVSFVTSLPFSTTDGGIGGPSYETQLRVVISLASFLRFGMVLLGKELELEGWLV